MRACGSGHVCDEGVFSPYRVIFICDGTLKVCRDADEALVRMQALVGVVGEQAYVVCTVFYVGNGSIQTVAEYLDVRR